MSTIFPNIILDKEAYFSPEKQLKVKVPSAKKQTEILENLTRLILLNKKIKSKIKLKV